jgi:uncharacterized protein YggU (UPF0235/DUF167 family)
LDDFLIINVVVKEGKQDPVMENGVLIVHTSAKRENNLANSDIISQLSKYYDVPVMDVRLLKGRTGRKKTFLIKERR